MTNVVKGLEASAEIQEESDYEEEEEEGIRLVLVLNMSVRIGLCHCGKAYKMPEEVKHVFVQEDTIRF